MARPKKEGLDYFPLDVDIDQDDKVALIEAKHGIEGFAVTIKLLMKIYKNGYFYKWTEKEQLLFSRRINVDINSVNAIVNDCLEWQMFNEDVFKKHEVLTSKGIQGRYLEAIGRRKEVVLNKDYLLVNPNDHLKNSKIDVSYINDDNNRVNVDINSIKDSDNPQSKGKERKKESKEVNTEKIQFADTVFLTQEEHDRLIADYGKNTVDDYIERLDEWQTNNPKKQKKDHNKTLRVWMKDVKKQKKPSFDEYQEERKVESSYDGSLF